MSGVNQTYPVSTPIQLTVTLRALRKSRKWTQEAVGRLFGVSQKRIACIESVPSRTSFDQISQLVTALGKRMVIEVSPPTEASNQLLKALARLQLGGEFFSWCQHPRVERGRF